MDVLNAGSGPLFAKHYWGGVNSPLEKSIRATSGPCDRNTALRSLPESRDSRRSRALSSATMTRPRLQSDFFNGLLMRTPKPRFVSCESYVGLLATVRTLWRATFLCRCLNATEIIVDPPGAFECLLSVVPRTILLEVIDQR